MSGAIPRRGGGVVIYVKTKWCIHTTILLKYTTITRDYETICLFVNKPNNRFMTILCVYRPPKGSIDRLVDYIRAFRNDPVVMGSEIWVNVSRYFEGIRQSGS